MQLQTIKEFNNFDDVIEVHPFSGVQESNLRLLFALKMFQIKKLNLPNFLSVNIVSGITKILGCFSIKRKLCVG